MVTRFFCPPLMPRSMALPTTVSTHSSSPSSREMSSTIRACLPPKYAPLMYASTPERKGNGRKEHNAQGRRGSPVEIGVPVDGTRAPTWVRLDAGRSLAVLQLRQQRLLVPRGLAAGRELQGLPHGELAVVEVCLGDVGGGALWDELVEAVAVVGELSAPLFDPGSAAVQAGQGAQEGGLPALRRAQQEGEHARAQDAAGAVDDRVGAAGGRGRGAQRMQHGLQPAPHGACDAWQIPGTHDHGGSDAAEVNGMTCLSFCHQKFYWRRLSSICSAQAFSGSPAQAAGACLSSL